MSMRENTNSLFFFFFLDFVLCKNSGSGAAAKLRVDAGTVFTHTQPRHSDYLSLHSYFTSDSMNEPTRIVLLGKTGSGKSSLANTIFGENVFKVDHTLNSETRRFLPETRSVNGRSITLIDTPGFYITGRSEKELKPDILRCICAPGPHAFLIVLKVEKVTEHEQAVINKMLEHFSEDALKYGVVVFTHGDDLPEGMKIEEFVSQNKNLSYLVKKCCDRCHVVDNKYWKNNQQDEYRSNQVHVAELLNTIEKMVKESNGGYYTDEKLQAVEKEIQKEEELIQKSPGNMSQEEIRKQAKNNVCKKQENSSSWTFRSLVFTVVNFAPVRFIVIPGLFIIFAVWINSKYKQRMLTENTAY